MAWQKPRHIPAKNQVYHCGVAAMGGAAETALLMLSRCLTEIG